MGQGGPYLKEQGVLADPLDGVEQVPLQGDVCAFLPAQEHTVLGKQTQEASLKRCPTEKQPRHAHTSANNDIDGGDTDTVDREPLGAGETCSSAVP